MRRISARYFDKPYYLVRSKTDNVPLCAAPCVIATGKVGLPEWSSQRQHFWPLLADGTCVDDLFRFSHEFATFCLDVPAPAPTGRSELKMGTISRNYGRQVDPKSIARISPGSAQMIDKKIKSGQPNH